MTTNPTLLAAKAHVLKLFNQYPDSRLVYHNFKRTTEIAAGVERLATEENAESEATEVAMLAAWFYGSGYLRQYDKPGEQSAVFAQAFLEQQDYPEDRQQAVVTIIHAAHAAQPVQNTAQALLNDAIHAYNMTTHFFHHRPLLRLEWELLQNRRLSGIEWNQLQLQALLQTKFYTAYAKEHYEPMIAQHILVQRERVEKDKLNRFQMVDEKEGQLKKFQGLEKRLPGSATQTFFRANYRNHINLSAIADNKANIMISVNAILISVVISILSYQNISQRNPMVILPVVIFLVTGLSSLIFAVLSIRPKVTSKNEGGVDLEKAKQNIVFFGNFVNLELEQFEEAVDAVLRDGQLLYGNMTRDLYFLGKVLDKKYRFLTISYNIFMVGFAATVITFLVAIFS
ncbi:MAG: Pycsar system effector family protein [Bacteroidota bacterium]